MDYTSLQSIVTKQPIHLQQMQIHNLFQINSYPHFELAGLKNQPQLMKRQLYNSFLTILEQWNKMIDNPNQQISQCQYKRNQFIFSSLKWLAIQNTRYIDSSLIRLQKWYNTSRKKEPTILIRRQNQLKAHAQEWQIRNSYRSNLPLEINNYKRRALFNIRSVCNTSRRSQKQKQNIIKENQVKGQIVLQQAKNSKKQNAYLRSLRQDQQIKDYFNCFRKSKVQFYKNLTKSYYKKQFSRDKIPTSTHQLKDRVNKNALINNYRIKTSNQGFRHPSRQQSSVFNQTSTIEQSYCRNSSVIKPDLYQTYSTFTGSNSLNTSNIDGLSLLVNPFETKIKKKKRI